MHLNPNGAFVWLYILSIYGGFFPGDKMFFIFWHCKQTSLVINTAFLAPPAETQSFHVNRCLWKFLEGFTLNQLSDWKLSEHAVRCAKEAFKRAWAVFTHADTCSHVQTARVKANRSPVKPKCLSQRLTTTCNQTEQKEMLTGEVMNK